MRAFCASSGYERNVQREISVLRLASHPGIARLVAAARPAKPFNNALIAGIEQSPESLFMIVEQLAHILDQLGADWVLWLLIVLSVFSVAVVIERLIFLARMAVPVGDLQDKLSSALDTSSDAALQLLAGYKGMEATVVAAGIRHMHRGAAAVVLGQSQLEGAGLNQRVDLVGPGPVPALLSGKGGGGRGGGLGDRRPAGRPAGRLG